MGAEVPEPDSPPGEPGPGEERNDTPVLHSTRLPAAPASTDRPSEDDSEPAGDLREALVALRSALDGRPGRGRRAPAPPAEPAPKLERASPPEPAPSPPSEDASTPVGDRTEPAPDPAAVSRDPRSPSLGRGLAVAALVAVVAAGLAAALALHPETRPSSASASTPQVPPSAMPSPAPVTTAMAWPGGAVLEPPGLTAAGPGATSPGLDLVAALDPDRTDVDVYERLLLRPGATTLDLAPAELGGLGPSLGIPADTVRDLQIELDGHAVRPARHGSGWHVTAPNGAGITRAVLRYRLTGVVLRQEPAPPGRVTIVLRPLGAAAMLAAHDPVTVRVEGPGVGTLTCPTSRSRLLCGAPAGDAGLAMLPADATAVVLAQVTRP